MTAARKPQHGEELTATATALVSGLLAHPEQIPGAMRRLREVKVLRHPPLEPVLRAMVRLSEAGQPVSLPAVIGTLERAGQIGIVGGIDALRAIEDYEPYPLNIEHHARRLRWLWLEYQKSLSHRRLADDPDNVAAKIDLDQIEGELAELRGELAPDARRLRLLTADEFARDVAPGAIVEALVYEFSTHSVNGASKAGKTWAAIQLAMAVCAGEPFLGLATVASPVLYLSLELSAGMLRDRMHAIHVGTGIPVPTIGEGFHVVAPTADYVPRLDLNTEAGFAELERLIGETGSRLVILDTLYKFLPGADPSSNGEMGLVYGRLNDLAQRTGAAPLLLDHVGKGEQLGPVSHSALGASVKGGAARVVIGLKRTSREDGGRWSLDVESHFGSWEEPLYYERPMLDDDTRGSGCVACTASEAHGLPEATLERVFLDFGERVDGEVLFTSKRKLREGLIAAKVAGGNAQGDSMIGAILKDYCAPESARARCLDRPVLTRPGPRDATVFLWRMGEPPIDDTAWRNSDAVL